MITLQLPYPPSVNTYWRHLSKGPLAGRTLLSEDGRKYRETIGKLLFSSKRVGTQRVKVDIECRMPDRRKRDLDNIPKALLDALTHGGMWDDDSQIDDLRVWRADVMGGLVVVTITPIAETQATFISLATLEQPDRVEELPF